MSESRAFTYADRLMPEVGRRALDRAGRAVMRAVYGTALYRASLRGRQPDALTQNPNDPWPGDIGLGAALARGEYNFGGQLVSARESPQWHPAGADPAWFEEAHSFGWLRDLEAAGSAEARTAARNAAESWLDRCATWDPLIWRPDVLGRRMVAWLTHAPFLFHAGDVALRARALASLAEQLRHLSRTAADAPDGEARFGAIKGLAFGALCLPGGERRLAQSLRLLDQEIGRQVLPDGCHFSRSPAAHLAVFRDLVELRTLLKLSHTPLPQALQGAIDRMAPILRFFRHGDGGLALFNDTTEESGAAIDVALALGEAGGKAPASAPHGGFERLAARRSLALVDVGLPPATDSRRTHAGTLSFEFSVGADRLIVNCGAYAGDRPHWRDAQRATAAHSTVTVDDTNVFEVATDGAVGRRPARVSCARHEDDGSIWIDTLHDGYRDGLGLTHRRRLFLDANGTDLRGEDVLAGPGGKAFALRFHLHPDVQASLVGDGQGALLRLSGGDGWRLRATGCTLQLAESVYLGRGGTVKRSEQVVLSGPLKGVRTTVKWALTRV